MLKRFEDLRFAIGSFFLIVGCLLVIAGFTSPTPPAAEESGSSLDLITGMAFIVFAIIALLLSNGMEKPGSTKTGS